MRPSDVSFGLFPLPKLDENPSEYIQFANGWCISAVVVPVNSLNPDQVGFFLCVLENTDLYFWSSIEDKLREGRNGSDFSRMIAANLTAFQKAIDKTIEAFHTLD